MLRIESHDGVICAGGKASLLGTSIPVWVYLVGDLLVDTGPLALKNQLTAFYADRPIRRAVLTHRHEDHSGLAAWLQEERGVRILAPAQAVDELAARARLPLYRRLIWGARPACRAEAVPDRIEASGCTLQVIPAPGHAPEHIALLEPERGWLFSGDIFVRPRPRVGFAEENMTQLARSIERLLGFDFQTLFCSHAGVLQGGRRALESKLEHIEALRRQVREFRVQGLSDARIAARLFPKKTLVQRISRGEWSSVHLVRSV